MAQFGEFEGEVGGEYDVGGERQLPRTAVSDQALQQRAEQSFGFFILTESNVSICQEGQIAQSRCGVWSGRRIGLNQRRSCSSRLTTTAASTWTTAPLNVDANRWSPGAKPGCLPALAGAERFADQLSLVSTADA